MIRNILITYTFFTFVQSAFGINSCEDGGAFNSMHNAARSTPRAMVPFLNRDNVLAYNGLATREEIGRFMDQAQSAGLLDLIDWLCFDLNKASSVTNPNHSFNPRVYWRSLLGALHEFSEMDPGFVEPYISGDFLHVLSHLSHAKERLAELETVDSRAFVVGTGFLREVMWMLQQPTTHRFEVVGIDHVERLAKLGQTLLPNDDRVKVFHDNALDIDPQLIRDESVDVAYLVFSTIFEFYEDPGSGPDVVKEKTTVLRNIFKKMRKPGVLVIDMRLEMPKEGRDTTSYAFPFQSTNGILKVPVGDGVFLHAQPTTPEKVMEIGKSVGFGVYHRMQYYQVGGKPRVQVYLTRALN